jgi:cell division protein FtsQ
MDRRGRELFEIGHRRTNPMQARHARPLPPPHAPHEIATASGGSLLAAFRNRHVRLLMTALAFGLVLGAAGEAGRAAKGSPQLERAVRMMGFGIDQVTLSGQHFTYDRDIFDALDLANVRSFAALDTAAVKSRIERLSWIDTAELTRVYPGRLDVRVTERKPFALWKRADRLYLIDKTGRVLAAVTDAALPALPRFAGEGAAAGAADLLELVARYPEIARRLDLAERVSERRWNLKLSHATTLKLPADGEAGALAELTRDSALAALVQAGDVTIDLRGPGRAAVRAAEPAPPALATGS